MLPPTPLIPPAIICSNSSTVSAPAVPGHIPVPVPAPALVPAPAPALFTLTRAETVRVLSGACSRIYVLMVTEDLVPLDSTRDAMVVWAIDMALESVISHTNVVRPASATREIVQNDDHNATGIQAIHALSWDL